MPTLRSCPQCAASVEFPDDRISDVCAFCEMPLVAGEGEAEPVDLVAPFDLDRGVAGNRLARHLQDSFWAPRRVRRLARPEELKGVLVPFYSYDATARSSYEARVGIYWYRTETYTVTVGGRTETRTRTVRETEWFPVSGTHAACYADHLVSGSRGLSEAEANALEPFDLGSARPFDPALVAGFVAERPGVGHAEARSVAARELAQRENTAIRAFLPGDQVAGVTNETRAEVEDVRLVLLPVWVATYRHEGRVFRLLVNGQTGEVVGRVPRSWAKIGCAVALGLAALAGLLAFVAEAVAAGRAV